MASPTSASRNIVVTATCPAGMRRREVWSIEQFQLLKKIGSGYASSVYLATCRCTGNQCAIKLYHKNKLSELNYFQVGREVKIHSRLSHTNVIQLWAAFEDQYGVYLVSEYASRGDVFSDVEKRGGQMTEAETVRQVIHPFLLALQYLHGLNIIHRDIKPENLLFTATGALKVADFGLSIDCVSERPVTRVGTLDYMAPEVVVCPDKHRPNDNKDKAHLAYTPVIDAWAVGVLAYELIVGRPPFDKGHKKLTIAEIINGQPPIPAFVSDGASSFIRYALTKDQHKRPNVWQLAEHPWIVSHMRQPVQKRTDALRLVGRADSFADARSMGMARAAPGSEADEQLQSLQLRSVAANGKLLHANSMTATDMMRWRDIAFNNELSPDSYDFPGALPKRKSDGYNEEGSRRVSYAVAGMPMPATPGALSRLNSGAPSSGISRHNSGAPNMYASPDSYDAPGSSSPSGGHHLVRPMTREEVFSSLQAASVELNRPGSFTSRLGRSGSGAAAGASAPSHIQRSYSISQGQGGGSQQGSPLRHQPSVPVGYRSASGVAPESPLRSGGALSVGGGGGGGGGLSASGGGGGNETSPIKIPRPPASPVQSPGPRWPGQFAASPSRMSASFSSPSLQLGPNGVPVQRGQQPLSPTISGTGAGSSGSGGNGGSGSRLNPRNSMTRGVEVERLSPGQHGSGGDNSALPSPAAASLSSPKYGQGGTIYSPKGGRRGDGIADLQTVFAESEEEAKSSGGSSSTLASGFMGALMKMLS